MGQKLKVSAQLGRTVVVREFPPATLLHAGARVLEDDDGVLDIVFEAGIAKRTFGPELLEWLARTMAVTLTENTLHADT